MAMMFLLAPGTSVASGLSVFEFALPLRPVLSPVLSPVVTVAMAAEIGRADETPGFLRVQV